MSLKTKNAFLTGGAQGLGKGYVEALLKLGARVVFVDVNPQTGKQTEEELRAKYGQDNVLFIPLDVTNEAQYQEVFDKAVSHLGFVDLLVNNAGILDESKTDLMIAINFTAMAKGTYIAEAHMRKDKGGRGGRIVNVASMAATTLEHCGGHPLYSGTKNAIRAFTSCLAVAPDIKEQGLEYGVLCPGPSDTTLMKGLGKKMRFGDVHEEACQAVLAKVDDVVNAFVTLVTQEDMNGAILEIFQKHRNFVRMARDCYGDKWPVEGWGKDLEPY